VVQLVEHAASGLGSVPAFGACWERTAVIFSSIEWLLEETFVAFPVETIQQRSGPYLLFSYNYPSHSFGIENTNEAWIIDGGEERFYVLTPGLTGRPGSVSLESEAKPNYFLRHRNSLIYLDAKANEDLYRNDATFMPRQDKFYAVSCLLVSFSHLSTVKSAVNVISHP